MARKTTQTAIAPKEELPPDLNSFDWGEEKFTDKEKLFCFWYANPDTRGNASLAARKAGFAQKGVNAAAAKLLKKEKLRKAIARLSDTFLKSSIEDAYRRVMQKQVNRATLDRTALFNYETLVNDKGQEYLKITPKKPDELTDEQKDLIDAIEFSGVYGIANYRLYPAEKAEREIARIWERMHGIEKEEAGFDVETVVDVIKDTLQVKTRLMQRNSEIASRANLRNSSSVGRVEED